MRAPVSRLNSGFPLFERQLFASFAEIRYMRAIFGKFCYLDRISYPNYACLTASPVTKLPPKKGGACFRAFMRGMDSSWGNFCDYSCYAG
jgi:hypothetical protein